MFSNYGPNFLFREAFRHRTAARNAADGQEGAAALAAGAAHGETRQLFPAGQRAREVAVLEAYVHLAVAPEPARGQRALSGRRDRARDDASGLVRRAGAALGEQRGFRADQPGEAFLELLRIEQGF